MTPFQFVYACMYVMCMVMSFALIIWVVIAAVYLIVLIFRRFKVWNENKCNTGR